MEELKEYKQKFGDTLVPQAYPGIGEWVARMRYDYKKYMNGEKSCITPKRVEALQQVGFVFDKQPRGSRHRGNPNHPLHTSKLKKKQQQQQQCAAAAANSNNESGIDQNVDENGRNAPPVAPNAVATAAAIQEHEGGMQYNDQGYMGNATATHGTTYFDFQQEMGNNNEGNESGASDGEEAYGDYISLVRARHV